MRKSSLLIIFLIVFIDLVGFGIVIPILPYYALSFGASAWELGWLMAIYSLMQFLVSPIWGSLSDRIGRRPVLLVSLLGTAVSMTFLGLANSLFWVFLARLFAGVAGANISTAYAYIADVTTEENRAKGMGMVGAAFGLGFIFGPAIGGVLSRYGYSFPMFVAAGMALLNLVFAYFRLEEPPLSTEVRASHRTRRFDPATIRKGLSDRRSQLAIGVFFLATLALTQMETTFAIYMKARFELGPQAAGMLLGLTGIIMVIVQGGLIGRLVKKLGEVHLILGGLFLTAIGLIGFAAVDKLELVVIAMSVLALGHGALHPSLSSLASLGAAEDRKGATMGVFQSASSLARVLGPLSAGWLYDQMGWGSPFYGGAVILAIGFALTWFGSRNLVLRNKSSA